MASKKKPAAKTKAKAKAKAKASAKAKPGAKRAVKTNVTGRASKAATSASNGEHRERFDREPYEIPLMDLAEAVALADALLESTPILKGAPPAITEDALHLTKARDRAKEVLARSPSTSQELSADARPFDVAMDRAWATFVRRIQDWSELPIDRFPDAALASKVHAIVHDLSILKLNYLAEFAQIGARIDSLKREDLLDAARTFAGQAFLDEVLHHHSEYGKAIGVMDSVQVDNDENDQGAARIALTDAIAEYTYQLLCLARAGQPDTWKAVRDALEPIAAVRSRQMRELRATLPVKRPAPHPPITNGSARADS